MTGCSGVVNPQAEVFAGTDAVLLVGAIAVTMPAATAAAMRVFLRMMFSSLVVVWSLVVTWYLPNWSPRLQSV
jgi:hypothetical protein